MLLSSRSEALSGLGVTDFDFQIDFSNGFHAQSARVHYGLRTVWGTRSGLARIRGTSAWAVYWQTRDISPLCSAECWLAFDWFITDFESSPVIDRHERKMASRTDL